MRKIGRSTVIVGAEAPGNRTRAAFVSLIAASVLAACAAAGPGGNASPPVEPRAGAWKTWVLASAAEIRLPTPPDAAATSAELAELQKLAAGRDVATLERIRYWDAGSPAYRWNELAIETSARTNTTSVPGARAFTLMSVAIDDALVAAWNAKYAYNRPRPTDADSGHHGGGRDAAEPLVPGRARRRRRRRLGRPRVHLAEGRGAVRRARRAGGAVACRRRRPVSERRQSGARARPRRGRPGDRVREERRLRKEVERRGADRTGAVERHEPRRRRGSDVPRPGCSPLHPSCGRLRRPLPTPRRARRRLRK